MTEKTIEVLSIITVYAIIMVAISYVVWLRVYYRKPLVKKNEDPLMTELEKMLGSGNTLTTDELREIADYIRENDVRRDDVKQLVNSRLNELALRHHEKMKNFEATFQSKPKPIETPPRTTIKRSKRGKGKKASQSNRRRGKSYSKKSKPRYSYHNDI